VAACGRCSVLSIASARPRMGGHDSELRSGRYCLLGAWAFVHKGAIWPTLPMLTCSLLAELEERLRARWWAGARRTARPSG